METELEQTTRFVQLGRILSRQVFMMAAGYSRRVLDAIVSLGDNGVVVCPDDQVKFAALIGDYFNKTDNDDSGSEEDVEIYSPKMFTFL